MKPQTELHLSNSFNNDKFKKLKKEWYGKLKDTGFRDIEDERQFLHRWSIWFQSTHTPEEYEDKQRYFIYCERFLLNHRFKNDIEKAIWSAHCEGKSLREITIILKAKGIQFYSKDKINKIIHELLGKMNRLWKTKVTVEMKKL